MSNPDLPYLCEYAKSGRAGCKKCKTPIEKDTLRLATVVQSHTFDGNLTNWFHYDCFFSKFRPKGPEEIARFDSIRFEDQKRIEKSIEEAKHVPVPVAKGKGAKKRKLEAVGDPGLAEFTVEYAKSNRSACVLCTNKIEKDEMRIGKLDHDSSDAHRYGALNRWFHLDCFVTARDELNYNWAGKDMPNFKNLEKADQKLLTKKLPALKEDKNGKAKVAKIEEEPPKAKKESTAKEDKQLKKQSDLLFRYVDDVKKLRKNEQTELYEYNDIETIPQDTTKRVEFLADALAFGLPQKCPNCDGCLHFEISKYACLGNVSGWEACSFSTEEPKRSPLKIPDDLKESYDFLKKYKYKPGKRVYNTNLKEKFEARHNRELALLDPVKDEVDTTDNGGVVSVFKLLDGYKVAIVGNVPCKPKIEEFGGTSQNSVDPSVLFIVSNEATVKKSKAAKVKDNLKEAEKYSIPIVTVDVFDLMLKNVDELSVASNVAKALVQSSLKLWDKSEEELEERVSNLNAKRRIETAFKSGTKSGKLLKSGKSQLTKSKVIYKNGAVVDPDSELENDAHILKEGDTFYNAILNLVNLSENKNSYYKIQLLEDDRLNGKYWVFKSWGRIGTERGDTKLYMYRNKQEAINDFKATYEERTQNSWDDRENFQKQPGGYYPVDIDYGEMDNKCLDVSISSSTLPKQVKDLISLIFDVTRMKQTMLEFELDLEKMPLGKLSKKQLLEACSTLKEISNINENQPLDTHKLMAACNKFYSLVPHSFGSERPPLIRLPAVISNKMEMLESLMDIELAYEIIKNVTSDEDPIDFHYRKLNTIIEPVDEKDPEFKIVQAYMQNTHAKTHSAYSLELVNLFRIQRQGEDIRFKRFAGDKNRMLLWHGSRLTNYVGILSQGLRIAPPEAPVCGYMFGKGVYFADSVSKSANYCCANMSSDTGLLLLSEVALGESLELTQSKFVTKLEKNYHSVKGVGSTHPDPKKVHIFPDGLKVPHGKMVKNKDVKQTALLYNEYIVYNEEQIKIRYLVNVKFNFDSLF